MFDVKPSNAVYHLRVAWKIILPSLRIERSPLVCYWVNTALHDMGTSYDHFHVAATVMFLLF